MPRPEKVEAVEEIKQRLETALAVFLTEYRGLSVAEQQSLRRSLREASTEYRIVKMSLARRAVEELGLADGLVELLTGPTALAFTAEDPVVAAKALDGFAKEHAQLLIKGGLLRGELLPPEKVAQLAELESREVLLARTAGAFEAPLSRMAGLMAAFTRNTATVLTRLLEQRQEAEGAQATPEPGTGVVLEPEAETEAEPEAETEAEVKAEAESEAPEPEAEAEPAAEEDEQEQEET